MPSEGAAAPLLYRQDWRPLRFGAGALRRLRRAAAWLGRYVWAGWAGLAGLFCLAAVWQLGHELYGSFILPAPGETLAVAWQLVTGPDFIAIAARTGERALTGFTLAAAIGTLAGVVAGYSFAAMRILKPIVTVTLGVPPIAWIVLALIWFGSGNGSAVMTVVLASMPISFAGALEGVATRNRSLDAMARVFGASPARRFGTVTLPHLLSYMFAAWTTTIGSAWKVTVMAELLSNTGGVGGELATARSLFDIPAVTAWILITVGFALVSDYGILHPLREAVERWRGAGLPWGVKR
jgi:NitT/TauT family transport system permease protein